MSGICHLTLLLYIEKRRNVACVLIVVLVFPARFSDPDLFVYCCDFSATAIELVKVSGSCSELH